MYLMDGSSQIMISKALNESDRLSSCSRSARKHLDGASSLFNVYSFQAIEDGSGGFASEEFLFSYNIGGININQGAFEKLRQEISLQVLERRIQTVWNVENVRLYSGVVPVGPGAFRRLIVREGRIARIDPRDFSFKGWTDHRYYEACSSQAIYDLVEATSNAHSATAD